MALIPTVGRKSTKMRLFVAALYLILTLGAVTTVYPFLIMLGESITSQYDQDKFAVIPGYIYSTAPLFGKYAEDKYAGDMDTINTCYGTNFAKLDDIQPPKIDSNDTGRVNDWLSFFSSLPMKYKKAGFSGQAASYSPSLLNISYQKYLSEKFKGDIRALDRAYIQEDELFDSVYPPFEQATKHNWLPDNSAKMRDWEEFKRTLPANFFIPIGCDPLFQKWLKEEAYNGKIDDLNKAWGTKYTDFKIITLTTTPTGNKAQQDDWEKYVRLKLPIRYLFVSDYAQPNYHAFLIKRYHGNIEEYNKRYNTTEKNFTGIKLPNPDTIKPEGSPLIDWIDFLKSEAPISTLCVDSLEVRYRNYIQNRDKLTPGSVAGILPPIQQADILYVTSNTGALRKDYALRNYQLVIRYMALHGRAVANTAVYCFLMVLTALVVNPFCAYALSRYNLSYGSSVLLFLLATMAFPGEVTQIPNFLLLKQLGLLNTFAALLLPAAANGYSIFLLKGFFDSLPKELYEAGTLDGATEMRMFWTITLPLAKPIFAVTALGAFTGAYGAFMFAMLVCPNPKMWTMMVWIYELQSSGAPPYVMLAALTLASIPTLLVFVFAQKTIMKGIILPSYK